MDGDTRELRLIQLKIVGINGHCPVDNEPVDWLPVHFDMTTGEIDNVCSRGGVTTKMDSCHTCRLYGQYQPSTAPDYLNEKHKRRIKMMRDLGQTGKLEQLQNLVSKKTQS